MTQTPLFSTFETQLMSQLLEEAAKYKGLTHPNPLVAAAVYHEGRVISIGAHKKIGDVHAEVDAINKARGKCKGASLMVTLEPCTHHGRTPPCVTAIYEAGIQDVVYASQDVYNKVEQNPARPILESKGIKVREGLLAEEARQLNHDYYYFHTHKRPYVILKAGMSLDGRIALASGQSKYITSEASLKAVHTIRAQVNGIVVGRKTLEIDNPALTVRYGALKDGQPLPDIFVVGKTLKTDKQYEIFSTGAKTIWVTPDNHQEGGAFDEICTVSGSSNIWEPFLDYCYTNSYYSVLIEGGASLYASALSAGIVNKGVFFIAPKIIGEADALSVVNMGSLGSLDDAITMDHIQVKTYGDDVMIEGEFKTSIAKK